MTISGILSEESVSNNVLISDIIFSSGILSDEDFGVTYVHNLTLVPHSILSDEDFGVTYVHNLTLVPHSILSEESVSNNVLISDIIFSSGILSEESVSNNVLISDIIFSSGILSDENFGVTYAKLTLLSFQINISPISANNDSFVYKSGFGESSIEQILTDLRNGFSFIQESLFTLSNGDPFSGITRGVTSLGIAGIQVNSNILNAALKGIQKDKLLLSSDPVYGVEVLKEVISEKDIISGVVPSVTSIGNTSYSTVQNAYDILLDGVSIKNSIESCDVTISQSSVHNSIEFSSFDMDLYKNSDPSVLQKSGRIEVHIKSRILTFLLETRNGEEFNFRVWGRSLTAIDDSPFSEEISLQVTSPITVSDLLRPTLSSTLIWDADDWVLPVGISLKGTPIANVIKMAKQIGAIVRSSDTGQIHVRKKYSVRPIDLESSLYSTSYNRDDDLIELSLDEKLGTEYNKIHVFGYSGDVQVPDLELEEPCVLQGSPCHVRAYWDNGILPTIDPSVYLTDGTFTDEGFHTEFIKNEIVEFKDGISSTRKPVTTLDPTDIAWIGADGGDISWSKYTKKLNIKHSAFRIANISYITTYRRYNLHGHNVSKLMQVLAIPPSLDISVILIQGDADKQAPDLTEGWLSSDYIATIAGTAWLDDNKYARVSMSAEAPYIDNLLDGGISNVEDGVLAVSGNVYVTEASIHFEKAKITNRIGFLQCQI